MVLSRRPLSGFNGSIDAPGTTRSTGSTACSASSSTTARTTPSSATTTGACPWTRATPCSTRRLRATRRRSTLVFDDWEALAGKSLRPRVGQSSPNNNPIQYQQHHPLDRQPSLDRGREPEGASRPDHHRASAVDPNWIVDHGYQYDLSLQTYEWLKHAAEDSYHNWYYNQAGGFPGNEQNFYNLVPVISGEQGDYHVASGVRDQRCPGQRPDGPKLPSGKIFGDLNTPGTLMHDAWAAIADGPAGAPAHVGRVDLRSLIYETAWHEEDYGSTSDYQGTGFGTPWPVPDPTWDGVNTWALRLQNHVRSVGILADAAQWAEDVRTGSQGSATVVQSLDLDQDGEVEYVMRNNRVYVCFERYGGRLTHGFAFLEFLNDAAQVLGSPLANPSEPGEEERVGVAANRCSTFKDMDPVYVDTAYAVQTGSNFVRFTTSDGKIDKRITLLQDGGKLYAEYTNGTGADLHVRVGASPDVLDMALYGREHMTVYQTATEYAVHNGPGAAVKVHLGNTTLAPAPLDAGYENRNLALVEQIEVRGGAAFDFEVELNAPGSKFYYWQEEHYDLPAEQDLAAAGADADGDFAAALVEYATRTDPNDSNDVARLLNPWITTHGQLATRLAIRDDDPDLEVLAEVCSRLPFGPPTSQMLIPTLTSSTSGYGFVTLDFLDTFASPADRERYLRLIFSIRP